MKSFFFFSTAWVHISLYGKRKHSGPQRAGTRIHLMQTALRLLELGLQVSHRKLPSAAEESSTAQDLGV